MSAIARDAPRHAGWARENRSSLDLLTAFAGKTGWVKMVWWRRPLKRASVGTIAKTNIGNH